MCPINMAGLISNSVLSAVNSWKSFLRITQQLLEYLSLNALCSASPAKMMILIRDLGPLKAFSTVDFLNHTNLCPSDLRASRKILDY